MARDLRVTTPKLRIVWNPQGFGAPNVPGNSAQAYYPGDAYVDVIGNDLYDIRGHGATWAAAGEIQIGGERCITPVVFTDEQHGYAGDTKPDGATRIWRTADAGHSWQPVDIN